MNFPQLVAEGGLGWPRIARPRSLKSGMVRGVTVRAVPGAVLRDRLGDGGPGDRSGHGDGDVSFGMPRCLILALVGVGLGGDSLRGGPAMLSAWGACMGTHGTGLSMELTALLRVLQLESLLLLLLPSLLLPMRRGSCMSVGSWLMAGEGLATEVCVTRRAVKVELCDWVSLSN